MMRNITNVHSASRSSKRTSRVWSPPHRWHSFQLSGINISRNSKMRRKDSFMSTRDLQSSFWIMKLMSAEKNNSLSGPPGNSDTPIIQWMPFTKSLQLMPIDKLSMTPQEDHTSTCWLILAPKSPPRWWLNFLKTFAQKLVKTSSNSAAVSKSPEVKRALATLTQSFTE